MATPGQKVFSIQWVTNDEGTTYYRTFTLAEYTDASSPENVQEHVFDDTTIWDFVDYIKGSDVLLGSPTIVRVTDIPRDIEEPV
jgi:hypothetical protein